MRYAADLVIVDKTRRYPDSYLAGLEPAYEDARYAAYRAGAAA